MSRRGNPFEELQRMMDRMSQQFDTEMGDITAFGRGNAAVDVEDRGEEFVVTVDLPGFERDDIDVTLVDDRLRIRAEQESDTETSDEEYIRHERRHQSVSRSITLPDAVDEDGVNATYTNGVLTVTLPKTGDDDDGGHQISVE